MPGPGPVLRHQLVVGELGLRVLVDVALVAVRRQVIDVEVVLLDVLTVIAFGIGQAEQEDSAASRAAIMSSADNPPSAISRAPSRRQASTKPRTHRFS